MAMTFRKFACAFALVVAMAAGCQGCPGCAAPESPGTLHKSDVPRAQAPQIDRDAQRAHRAAEQDLAFEVLGALSEEQSAGNVLFSPYALASALAKIYAGAEGDTGRQMSEVLGLAVDDQVLHGVFNELDRQFERQARQGDFVFHVVNALMVDDAVQLRGDYLDLLATHYDDGVHTLDFSGGPDLSRRAVNQWVAAQTNNRFPDHLPEAAMDDPRGLALASAIYFHARWQYRFDSSDTGRRAFRGADGSTSEVEMMRGEKAYRFFRDGRTRAAALRYDGANVSFLAIKPATEEQDFRAWSEELDGDYFRDIVDGLGRFAEGEVGLPKFTLQTTTDLEDVLSELGVTSPFDAEVADLSAISENGELFVAHAAQGAVIEIDEHGGHAEFEQLEHRAGAAGQAMHFDRPFYFAVYDQATDTILLLGRVVEL